MKTKKIKDNISKEEYKLLINSLRGDISIRENRQKRLMKSYVLLYNLGIRVNELNQITNNKLLELLSSNKCIIKSHKQNSEKYIYITESSKKEIKKIFGDIEANDNLVFVSERGSKKTALESSSMIRDINTYLKKVFGKDTRITSHSFRQTLISNLAVNGINTKIIQNLIGHKSINTTYRYIKTSESDITSALKTVR